MQTANKKNIVSFITEYVRVLLRHKFLIVTPLVAIFLGSTIVGSILPKVYRATATFQIVSEAQLTRRTIRSGSPDDLEVMKEIIFSRNSVVQVITDVGLDAPYKDLPESQRDIQEEELVREFQKNLQVQEKAKRVFEISYRDQNPETAARVANAVMTRYIERVVTDEKTQMTATVTFLEKQVKEYQDKVNTSALALEEFRSKHILDLPGTDLSTAFELKKIREDLTEAELQLSDAETAKKKLEEQMASAPSIVVGETVVETNPVLQRYRTQLERLNLELGSLKSRFTDLHPEVVKKKNEIDNLNALLEKEAEKITTKETRQANPEYERLRGQLSDQVVRIESLKRRKEQLLAKKTEAEKRIQNAPTIEKQMAELMDDDALNSKLLEYYTTQLHDAKVELEREIDQKGTRFQVIDSARRQSSPGKSKTLKVAVLGLVLGGGLGLGLAVLKEQMDTSFKDVEDASSFLSTPVIGTIPVISTTAEKARERKKEMIGWALVGALVLLLGSLLIIMTLTYLPGR